MSFVGRMELLEIAKASTAKSLGIANLDLPASLRTVPVAKQTNCGTAVANAAKFEVRIPGISKQNLQNYSCKKLLSHLTRKI